MDRTKRKNGLHERTNDKRVRKSKRGQEIQQQAKEESDVVFRLSCLHNALSFLSVRFVYKRPGCSTPKLVDGRFETLCSAVDYFPLVHYGDSLAWTSSAVRVVYRSGGPPNSLSAGARR